MFYTIFFKDFNGPGIVHTVIVIPLMIRITIVSFGEVNVVYFT